jgi:hypothetical protein
MYCRKFAPHSCDLHAERVGLTADGNDGGRLSCVYAIHLTSLPFVVWSSLVSSRTADLTSQRPEA